MRTLVVGAGATGGYIGVQLLHAGRDVDFLVRQSTRTRLAQNGVQIHRSDGTTTSTPVSTVTVADLNHGYDIVLLTVRSTAVDSAIGDITAAVVPTTRIIPVVNGMDHIAKLVAAFGNDRVLGGVAKLATSMLVDGTIDEVQPGTQLHIGQLDGPPFSGIDDVVAELTVDGINVAADDDILTAMWDKFAFIASTASLTCLAGGVIGGIARTDGGVLLAERILDEVASIATAEGHSPSEKSRKILHHILTDPASPFAPSMFRDMSAGRPVESSVLEDLAARGQQHHLYTPLLDAARVVVNLHARRHAEIP